MPGVSVRGMLKFAALKLKIFPIRVMQFGKIKLLLGTLECLKCFIKLDEVSPNPQYLKAYIAMYRV